MSAHRTLGLAAVACALVVGVSAARSQPAQRESVTDYMPPGAAKNLVARYCSQCHALSGTIQLRKPKHEWEAIVFDMVARGAPLMVEEAELAVQYLTDAFGPSSPPLVDVNTASKEDLAKLPGVTPAGADRLIAHRTANGPFPAREQVQALLRVDDRTFDTIKWYMRAGTQAPR